MASAARQIDTVALCGGSMSGAIIWALDATDIHSGWTEVRAVWNRSAHNTRERLSEIEAALPFALKKLDFDNGSEPERSGDSQPQAARRAKHSEAIFERALHQSF